MPCSNKKCLYFDACSNTGISFYVETKRFSLSHLFTKIEKGYYILTESRTCFSFAFARHRPGVPKAGVSNERFIALKSSLHANLTSTP